MSVADSIETRPSAPARLRASFGQRGIAFVLALAIELLVALLLWFMAPVIPGRDKGPIPTVFGIEGPRSDSEEADRTPEKKSESKAASGKPRPVPPKPVEPPPPVPEPPVPPLPSNFVRMTRPEFKSADIAGKGTAPSDPAEGKVEAPAVGDGSRAGDTAIVGKAPNGEPLYDARWYRLPTQAELAPYRPRHWARAGVGKIACRTAPRYRLVDCQIVGESPTGSGFGNAALQASWQFLMRPPRVGGKDVIGAWVLVTGEYDYVVK